MSEFNYGDNVEHLLYELSQYYEDEIKGSFEIRGEDESGVEGYEYIEVSLLADDAMKLIAELKAERDALAAELRDSLSASGKMQQIHREACKKAEANQIILTMTQEQMQQEANIYRFDNDEGTKAWFDATDATWTEGHLSQSSFHHIFKQHEAGPWLENEIRMLEEDGRCTQSYEEIRQGKTSNPVVVVFHEGRFVVWDGFHRIAGAIARKESVYAIFAHAPAADLAELVPEQALNGQARFLGDKEPYYNRGWNACRAAILRNIEEAR